MSSENDAVVTPAKSAPRAKTTGLAAGPAAPGVKKVDPILVVDAVQRRFGGLTAVDGQDHTGDERRLVRRQEQGGVGDVPSGALAAHGDGRSSGRGDRRPSPIRATASTAIGVSMKPGMMALARTPCLALVTARFWVSAFTPAFDSL